MLPEMTAPPFVDGIAVQLHLLRTGLPDTVKVFSKIPDQLRSEAANGAVVIRRAAGQSTQPQIHSRFTMSYRVWAPTDQAAYLLSGAVAALVFNAWKNQIVTPYGHIAAWAESSGFQDIGDPGLPELGAYTAVYDLLIRNPRPT